MDSKNSVTSEHRTGLEVAVIGMAYRFPAAKNPDEFWRNLKDGVESVSFFSDRQLEASGIDQAVYNQPQYVKAGAILEGVELFDAEFFGYSPRDAEIMDPQHRLFLECCWEALEDAAYSPETYGGLIGVYAGASMSSYLLNYVLNNFQGLPDPLQAVLGNDKDFLAARVSYKLNLEGPSIVVQSACSTGLVAIHLANQALLSGECDIALAGAASIRVPQETGYFSARGGILSPDGHCRVFDAKARGTVRGNGVGVVVLKRLADALADGDNISAVIKGSAINNDGASKIGFTAPRVDGQAKVIRTAHLMAEVEPETITFVEAHGTGTELGDPIEVEALTKVFSASTDKKSFCAIGSVKSNIGHLDATAGIAGFIKTILSLKNRMIPPSLNFDEPNPRIDFQNSPFYVNTQLRQWQAGATRRRAGVSSFGMGGTNAHVVLEEAPEREASSEGREWQLLILSAKTSRGVERATERLSEEIARGGEERLADVAYTLSVGRREFNQRRAIVVRGKEEAVKAMRSLDPQRVLTGCVGPRERKVAFMFSGQGAQYPGMALGLYESEPTFRKHVDHCSELLIPDLGFDLRAVLYPPDDKREEAARRLSQTFITQPALFVIEYGLAQLLIEWGVSPQAMIGHSIGEYVAACLAGVFSLEEGLALVATRGRLMQQLPPGAMSSVRLAESEVRPLLSEELSLAAINGPSYCVVSGRADAIEEFEKRLACQGVKYRRLHTSHAFHSQMMEPVLESFTEAVRRVRLKPPRVPFISNVTGTWITASEATDADYWARHLRRTVRFSDGLGELLKEPDSILVEVGPGDTLTSLARLHTDEGGGPTILSSLRHAQSRQADAQHLLTTLGHIWLAGFRPDWSGFYAHERRRRVSLPTYPFERQRYWLEPRKQTPTVEAGDETGSNSPDIADWFYTPLWKESDLSGSAGPAPAKDKEACWLIFSDGIGLGLDLARRLERDGKDVRTVIAANGFARFPDRVYSINPTKREDYSALIGDLRAEGRVPAAIIHLWNVTADDREQSRDGLLVNSQFLGFYSLLFLAQALGKHGVSSPLQLRVVTSGMQKVIDEPLLHPEKATILGPCKCIPVEYTNVACQSIDITISDNERENLADALFGEIGAEIVDTVIAYRKGRRWVRTFEPIPLKRDAAGTARLRERGTYLITGGLGGLGLTFARYLAQTLRAKLALTSRSGFPRRQEWDGWLAGHEAEDEVSRKIAEIREIEEAGGEVMVLRADVCDRQQMEEVKEAVVERFGEIHGVIHAAGTPGDGVIQMKTLEQAAGVLAPKVKGTLVLDELFKDAKLDFFMLCSSLTAVQPTFGQVDYCGANAFLDAFAHHSARRETFTVSVNWDRWNEVGMAVEAESRSRIKQAGSLSQSRGINHPLFDRRLVGGPDEEVYATEFSVDKHWLLGEHRVLKKATLPGTVFLEMARAVIEMRLPDATIEIRDVTFLSPLVLADDERKEVRTIVKKNADQYEVRFVSGSEPNNGERADLQEHARLRIGIADSEPPRQYPLADILERCDAGEIHFQDRFDQSRQEEAHIQFGPRWRSLKEVRLGVDLAVARLELAEEFAGDLEKYKLHPSLLDLATSANTFLPTDRTDGAVYLPIWYKSLKIKGRFSRKLYSLIKYKNHAQSPGETVVRDIAILDERGRELVAIEGFTLKRVPDDLVTQAKSLARGPSSNGDFRKAGEPSHHAPDNKTEADGARPGHGLSCSQGMEAFSRILSQSRRQVIVSTLPLLRRIDEMSALKGSRVLDALKATPRSKHVHPRPMLANPYVAARNKVERTIAGIWQEMLGIERVGINDNFFELGGNSLMGIEVVSELSKAFDVEVSVVSLYEGPTVSSLSRLLTEAEGSGSSLDNRHSRGERRRAKIEQRIKAG